MSRELVFQDNIGHLYNVIKKMKRGKEAIAMAPEQTKTYMQAFSGWQRLNPKTKLGRPPPGKKNIFMLARCADLFTKSYFHQGPISHISLAAVFKKTCE